MQLGANGKKYYFAPDGQWLESLPKVRKYIEELENGTAKPAKKRKKSPTENTNEMETWTFSDHDDLKSLTGWKRQKKNSGAWQYIAPNGTKCNSMTEVRNMNQYDRANPCKHPECKKSGSKKKGMNKGFCNDHKVG